MATYTKLSATEIIEIASQYNLDVTHFKAIDGGNSNSNYQLETPQGTYVLTIAEESSMQEVQSLTQLLQYFNAKGFSTSEIQLTTGGTTTTTFNNKPVLLKRWITGEVRKDLTATEAQQTGRRMAELHGIPAPDYIPRHHPFGHKVFSTVIGKSFDKDYENWLTEQLHIIRKTLPLTIPKGLIHGDLFYDNVLFEKEKIKAIIDFEEASYNYLVLGLGMGIIGLCQTSGKIDWSKAQAFLRGYESVRSLSTTEKSHLQFFTIYAATAISRWRYWKYNIDTPYPERRNKHREMMQIAISLKQVLKHEFLAKVFGL